MWVENIRTKLRRTVDSGGNEVAMQIEIKPTGAPAGAEVRGITLSGDISADEFSAIEAALHQYGMIFFRNQNLAPGEQERLTRRFGEPETPVLEQYTVPGHRDIIILSNVLKDDGRPVGLVDAGQFWHSDSTYRPEPARCSILHAIEIPTDEEGKPLGDTLFVRTDTAYDRLSNAMKARLKDMRAIHSFAHPYKKVYEKSPEEGGGKRDKLTEEQRKAAPDSIHPVVRTHPATGRKCLYVNEGLTAGFVGMDEASSEALLEQLCAHCTPEDAIYRHKWQVGDVVIWDNCMAQHHATGGYHWPRQRRYLHRTTVKGSVPY